MKVIDRAGASTRWAAKGPLPAIIARAFSGTMARTGPSALGMAAWAVRSLDSGMP